jgi:hypothetical protein
VIDGGWGWGLGLLISGALLLLPLLVLLAMVGLVRLLGGLSGARRDGAARGSTGAVAGEEASAAEPSGETGSTGYRGYVNRAPAAEVAEAVAEVAEWWPYRKTRSLFSPRELAFHRALHEAVGETWWVFGKVRLEDLLWLPRDTPERQRYRNYVQSKHVDFVLCAPGTLAPVLVIELDDASHRWAARQARDALVDRILAWVELPILHWSTERAYTPETLAAAIAAALGEAPAA